MLASATVVATRKRRASSIDEAAEKGKKVSKMQAFEAKYSTGDLGDGMSADLNYTLKRLIR